MFEELAIRPAGPQDAHSIRRMVRAAQLDPTSLKWQRFLVAEDAGQIVSIGQVKHYPGCYELGSLVTLKRYRGRGLARRIIVELEAQAPRPLYLLCQDRMAPFYEALGYQRIGFGQAPAFLRLKLLPAYLFRLWGVRVLILVKDQA